MEPTNERYAYLIGKLNETLYVCLRSCGKTEQKYNKNIVKVSYYILNLLQILKSYDQ
jgi:hypothetical protein